MANIKLDFSKMKHVRSDAKSTTLRHPDGHEITLAHKALNPENQKQLQALSGIAGQAATPLEQDQMKHKMASGGSAGDSEGYDPSQVYGTPDVDAQIEKERAGNNTAGAFNGVSMDAATAGDAAMAAKQSAISQKYQDRENQRIQKQPMPTTATPAVAPEAIAPIDTGAMGPPPVGLAKGGEAKPCPMCGGGMSHYDEGGQVTQAVPDYKDPMSATQGKPQTPLTPEIQRTRDLYNQAMSFNAGIPTDVQEKMNMPRSPTEFGSEGQPPSSFSPQTWNQSMQAEAQEKQNNAANIATQQQKIIAENQARVQAGLDPLPVPNVPDGQQIPGSPEAPATGKTLDQPPTPPVPGADPLSGSLQNTQNMMQKGFNQSMAGIQQGATAAGQLGMEQAAALQKGVDARTAALAQYQNDYKDLNTERQNFIQDIQNGHIDVNKYWTGDKNGDGSHSKIMAGIGMILGGFNPSNKPNAAIDFLKYQMDKNIEAQSKNLDMKQNLLTANTRQFGNLKDGLEMTRIMQGDMMAMNLQQAASKAATPLAKAAALQAAGNLQMEFAPRFQQFAMQRAMMNLAQNGADPNSIDHMLGYMRVVNPEMAKEMESRYVPGVGMSPNQPVPQDVRQQIIAKNDLHNLATDLLKYSSTHTNLIPGTPEYNTGAAKAFNLKQKYREATLGGILRQGEMPLLDSVLSANPAGAFKELNSIPKLKEMIELNGNSLNTLKRGYGLPETKMQQPPVLRKTSDGRTAIFDPESKQFLGYK